MRTCVCLAAFVLLALPISADAQSWWQQAETWLAERGTAHTTIGLEVWPTAHRGYQHQYWAGGRASLRFGAVEARGYAAGRFWQTDESQWVGSPFHAENNLNVMVRYGGSLVYYLWGGLHLGPAIHRTERHVVWRFKKRNGYRDGWGSFEGNPNWRGREELCRDGDGCGSIAYAEQVGAVAGWQSEHVTVTGKYLFWRYKQLTRAPTPWRLRGEVRFGGWQAKVRARHDLRKRWRGDVSLARRLVGRLWGQVRVARVQPDHKKSFDFIGLSLLLR